jgi:hypothetical protein
VAIIRTDVSCGDSVASYYQCCYSLADSYHPADGCDTTLQELNVRFEVFTAVNMKNGVFRDVTPCGFCKNGRFGGT